MRMKLLSIVGLLIASGTALAQIPISGLPPATLPLGTTDKIIVNQPINSAAYSTRQAPLSALAPFFPTLTSHYLLQSADPTLTQSRVLAGTANQVILTDGGALGNLTLSLPQNIATSSAPTFGGLTLTGALGGTSGVFSGTLQSAGYTGTTGSFSGTLSSAGYTGTSGSFSGALSAGSLSLTAPLPATSGGTGFASYAVGDLLAASTTTALSHLAAVASGSYLRSAGANTLPVYSTLTLPNAATTGDILYATAANTIGNLPDVNAGSYLRSGGTSTVPLWSTITLPNAATAGDLIAATATNTIGNITDVAAGSYLRSGGAGTLPAYSSTTIPNTSVLGDVWFGSAANVVSPLAGNATTTNKFLTQTGTGAVSAAPAWNTIQVADLPASARPINCTTVCNVAAIAVGQSAYLVKGTTSTRTSTSTLSIDADLQFTNVPAGIYSMVLTLLANSGGGGLDIQIQCTNVGALSLVSQIGAFTGGASATFGVSTYGIGSTIRGNTLATSAAITGIWEGHFQVTAGSTVDISWAQDTINATAASLLSTSTWQLTRLQ